MKFKLKFQCWIDIIFDNTVYCRCVNIKNAKKNQYPIQYSFEFNKNIIDNQKLLFEEAVFFWEVKSTKNIFSFLDGTIITIPNKNFKGLFYEM